VQGSDCDCDVGGGGDSGGVGEAVELEVHVIGVRGGFGHFDRLSE